MSESKGNQQEPTKAVEAPVGVPTPESTKMDSIVKQVVNEMPGAEPVVESPDIAEFDHTEMEQKVTEAEVEAAQRQAMEMLDQVKPMSAEEIEDAENKILFKDLDINPLVLQRPGEQDITFNISPMVVKRSKRIKALVDPVFTKMQKAATTDTKDRVTDDEMWELIEKAAGIIAEAYISGINPGEGYEWVQENLSQGECMKVCISQVKKDRDSDFLPSPLRIILLALNISSQQMTSKVLASVLNLRASDGTLD